MHNWRGFFAFIWILFLAGFAFNSASAQNGGEQHFPKNVVLKGEFLKYYRSVPDRQLLFGNAISNEFDFNGKLVQYFDRARFELVMTDKGPQVQLAPLGYFLFDETSAPSSEVTFPSPTCRYFPKYGGHRVCYSFLKFYDEHNGPIYFGSPVSELIYENGQFVQYFEYARFEYRFNMVADRVGLTNVGQLSMKRHFGQAPPMDLYQGPARPLEVTDIQARAFVSRALVAPGTANTLFVVVHWPNYEPVADARVNISIQAGNKLTRLPVTNTDADGIARIEIPAYDLAPRQVVELQVIVNYQEQAVKTSTWYRIWY